MSKADRPKLSEIAGGKSDLSDLLARVDSRLQVGGRDGGGGAGLEPRVAKLEADVEYLKRDVGELRTDMRDVRDRLTRIETRVDHLPTKGFIVTSVVITLAVMTTLITFQDRVQRLVRQTSPVAASSTSPVMP